MQVFRYITFIWEDYEKEQEMKHPGISKTKEFCYPPVLPIWFYDGVENWTAATSLHERVLLSDMLGKYIPDYQCILIQLKEYSSAELMKKKDELSVLMMIDRLRNVEDYGKFREEMDEVFLKKVIGESPEYLLSVMAQVIRMFLAKLNVPWEEVDAFTEQIKERKMGELFKYFEGWDIQAVRREVKEEKEKAVKEAVEKATEEVRKEVTKEVTEEVTKEVTKEVTEDGIHKLLRSIKKYHATREDAVIELMGEYELSRESAEEKVTLYW